jgi:hypothetical protein
MTRVFSFSRKNCQKIRIFESWLDDSSYHYSKRGLRKQVNCLWSAVISLFSVEDSCMQQVKASTRAFVWSESGICGKLSSPPRQYNILAFFIGVVVYVKCPANICAVDGTFPLFSGRGLVRRHRRRRRPRLLKLWLRAYDTRQRLLSF